MNDPSPNCRACGGGSLVDTSDGVLLLGACVFKSIETPLFVCGCIAATCFFLIADCLAADVALPNAMSLKAPPIANNDWRGLYAGGHVGYGRGPRRNNHFEPNPTAAGSSFASPLGGLPLGYNYLWPHR